MNLPTSKTLIISLALGALMFGASVSAGLVQPVSAKLVAPLSAPKNDVIAADVIWSCAGDTCESQIERRSAMARDCRPLARQVGKIASFKVGSNELDAAGLEACNRGLN